jgi:uncharacterized phage protein (TIGR02220 family)
MTPLFWKYLIVSSKRKKFVSMWVEIASHMDDLPVQLCFRDLYQKYGYSRSGLYRHMEEVKQFWNKSGTNLGQSWRRGGLDFQSITNIDDTKLKQTWNKVDTKLKQKKKLKTQDDYEAARQKIIDYLNEKTGKKYRTSNKQTKKDIDARLKEGYVYEDFCQVIDNKSKVWSGTQQEIYLRPVTLFGNKFDSYLNERPQNPQLSMHQKISNHVTKAERYKHAISEADGNGGIDFTQFVEVNEGDEKNS